MADGAREIVKYTVVLTADFPSIARDILAGEFDVIAHPTEQARSEDEIITLLEEADAAITLLSDPLTRRVLSSNPNLRMVANYAVGYNNIDVDAARELRITITNTPGVLTEATADLTMALILAITRPRCGAPASASGSRCISSAPASRANASASSAWGASARQSRIAPARSAAR
jgi:phosphoglycerate dehydrogenase-like enzyme